MRTKPGPNFIYWGQVWKWPYFMACNPGKGQLQNTLCISWSQPLSNQTGIWNALYLEKVVPPTGTFQLLIYYSFESLVCVSWAKHCYCVCLLVHTTSECEVNFTGSAGQSEQHISSSNPTRTPTAQDPLLGASLNCQYFLKATHRNMFDHQHRLITHSAHYTELHSFYYHN